jgi:heat shock protein HslJ
MIRPLAVALLLVAPAAAVAQDGLAVSAWRATSVGPQVVPEGVEAVVRFGEGGQLTGTGGCNRFSGTYESGSGELTIGPVAATRMACPGPAMEIEQALFAAFGELRRYRVDGAELFLSAGDGTNLVTLVQTTWE